MDNNFDSPETAQKFFDRFFAYDLLDRYPNHKSDSKLSIRFASYGMRKKFVFKIGNSAKNASAKSYTTS